MYKVASLYKIDQNGYNPFCDETIELFLHGYACDVTIATRSWEGGAWYPQDSACDVR